ncbi:MAG: HAD-IA family hydrolase [Candidatus Latescibacteria bacterium]|nr:HAD-IA family hydrolase [Candidatus Latescibacterota bacterium]MCK5526488.1 HAD-IA family hydrolase [Candidatus Latescibacterota bacterium]MCK5734217.1 HAD-IA family hydrolase [Candidatus Latescibacterota bacterium]
MIRGVIFDMDGTITVPYIDWKALRAEIRAREGSTLIEYIESLDADERRWATGVLERFENEAAVHSELNGGVRDLLDLLKIRGIRTALVTNNNGRSMSLVLEKHGLTFDVILSRDDGRIKPSAELVLKAMARLDLDQEEVVLIGDGRYDLWASEEAGIPFILLRHPDTEMDHQPAVTSLEEVAGLLGL